MYELSFPYADWLLNLKSTQNALHIAPAINIFEITVVQNAEDVYHYKQVYAGLFVMGRDLGPQSKHN